MPAAQGRLDHGPPVGVIDIGSNSVRLVVYEGLTRSPTPIFNEKVLAGLGREVQTTKLLAPDAVDKALAALRRYRTLCDRIGGQQAGGLHLAPEAGQHLLIEDRRRAAGEPLIDHEPHRVRADVDDTDRRSVIEATLGGGHGGTAALKRGPSGVQGYAVRSL